MKKLKYVTGQVDTRLATIKTAVVFNEKLDHSEVAKLFARVSSAGFCEIISTERKVICYGESFTLKTKSIPEVDNLILTSLLFPIDNFYDF
jgi:hypothetical protein